MCKKLCGKSYEYGALSAYGAQVNDSTDYQVYNVTPENENSISAVKATYGQVLMYNGEIANTYFFCNLLWKYNRLYSMGRKSSSIYQR